MALVKKTIDFPVAKCTIPCMNEDRLLSKKEVLVYLRISMSTLDRILMKEMPYIKLGKRVLFRKSDIDKYLETKKVK